MVDELLHSIPRLWRGSRVPESARRTLPTGFAELDRELPGGGWPLGAVIELLVSTIGIGELQLLLPALRELSLAGNHVLFIHPPYELNAPALHAAGVDLDRLLVIGAEDGRDILWAAEQALRNPACGAVILWARGADRQFSDDKVRRLQVAAQDGQSILFLYRLGRKPISRWAALRIELLPAPEGLQLSVLKAAGTHRRPQVHVPL
ncbi:MAG: translesion DNA synthesis-associated protein ImuA [Gammaproteobacteria bacterium]|nr:translesion DNA synthesis-associated protein ImuA [Gammaproteobacteria bacterium]